MTVPLVNALSKIRDNTFGKAGKKIKKEQDRYAKACNHKLTYIFFLDDEKHQAKVGNYKPLRKGMNVQYRKHKTKQAKGHSGLKWFPRNRPLKIHGIDHKRRVVYLRDPKSGLIHKKSHPFERIRRFKS